MNSPTNAAKSIRAALKTAFAGTKFSVVKESYTTIRVRWTNGPTVAAVDAVVGRFENGHFDGMQDMYVSDRPADPSTPDRVDYVMTTREISEDVKTRALEDLTNNFVGGTDRYYLQDLRHRVVYASDLTKGYGAIVSVDGFPGFRIAPLGEVPARG